MSSACSLLKSSCAINTERIETDFPDVVPGVCQPGFHKPRNTVGLRFGTTPGLRNAIRLVSAATRSPLGKLKILGSRNFGLLWVGSMITHLGDAFTFVAFPWLVIQLSDNAVALGSIIAIEALPRAVFILVGGALTDRFSPRQVLIIARTSYLFLMVLLCFLVLTGNIELWMVFVFAFLVGTVSAFGIPAGTAILPQIVKQQELPFANSVMGSVTVLSFLVGPALAGMLIVWFSGGDGSQTSLQSLGYIFVIDAFSLLVAMTAMILIRIDGSWDRRSDEEESIFGSIKSGASYLFQDRGLFLFTLYSGVIMFLFFGTIMVGFPLLANERLPEGAAAYGLLMSSLSAGMLFGIVLAGLSTSEAFCFCVIYRGRAG